METGWTGPFAKRSEGKFVQRRSRYKSKSGFLPAICVCVTCVCPVSTCESLDKGLIVPEEKVSCKLMKTQHDEMSSIGAVDDGRR